MKNLTSIIILSYNTRKLTQECIESIRRFTKPEDYELIVIENASSDDSLAYLQEQKDIRLIVNKENLGFPKGCNQGMRIARGTEIMLLNSDTLVTPRWLENLRYALYSAPDIGAVGPVSNKVSHNQQIPCSAKIPEEIFAFAETYNHHNPEKWEERKLLTGFALLLKREVMETIGLLDEIFTPGNCEDDDYCMRMLVAGYRILLAKDTFIWHYGTQSFIKLRSGKNLKTYDEIQYENIEKNIEILRGKWNLSMKWNVDNHFDLPLNSFEKKKVLLLESYSGSILNVIRENSPNAILEGFTAYSGDALLAKENVRYVKNLEEDVFKYLYGGGYNLILLQGLEKFKDLQGFLRKIKGYLLPHGEMGMNDEKGFFRDITSIIKSF